MPRIYENFVGQVSGIGEHKAGAMQKIVLLKQQIVKAETELQVLQKKMRREPQFDRQVQMNKEVKAKRAEIEGMKSNLKLLK